LPKVALVLVVAIPEIPESHPEVEAWLSMYNAKATRILTSASSNCKAIFVEGSKLVRTWPQPPAIDKGSQVPLLKEVYKNTPYTTNSPSLDEML
jgi:hypothetical protein